MMREIVTGKITVADGAVDEKVELGFKPSYLKLVNQSDVVVMEWFDSLAAGYWLKTVTGGTFTVETTGGPVIVDESSVETDNNHASDIVPTPNIVKNAGYVGFKIPNANLTTGHVWHYLAVRN